MIHDTMFKFRMERTPHRFRYVFLTDNMINSEPSSSDDDSDGNSLDLTKADEAVRAVMSSLRMRVSLLESRFALNGL